jgi:Putative addiction module component
MATIIEIEQLALTLPEEQRATLAANLLDSLTGVLSDDDEGIAEALRRDLDLDANPTQAISLAQLDDQIKSRRG